MKAEEDQVDILVAAGPTHQMAMAQVAGMKEDKVAIGTGRPTEVNEMVKAEIMGVTESEEI